MLVRCSIGLRYGSSSLIPLASIWVVITLSNLLSLFFPFLSLPNNLCIDPLNRYVLLITLRYPCPPFLPPANFSIGRSWQCTRPNGRTPCRPVGVYYDDARCPDSSPRGGWSCDAVSSAQSAALNRPPTSFSSSPIGRPVCCACPFHQSSPTTLWSTLGHVMDDQRWRHHGCDGLRRPSWHSSSLPGRGL